LLPEQQQVFTETGLEITDWTYDKAAENEAAYLEEMRKNAEVNTVDFEAFQEKVTSVYENYIARFGDEWIKDVEAAK
jgi:TRAP-type C4-dicarboxylate transport system substrate-binding protein